jgi:cytochrome subunit of sulfide dehydrogenase
MGHFPGGNMLVPIRSFIGIAVLCTVVPSSHAAPPAGQLLASQCAQCHGTNGNGPGFDELAGKGANELYNELREMKNRVLIEGIMDRQARGYTDGQLRLIADFLSSLPGGGDD